MSLSSTYMVKVTSKRYIWVFGHVENFANLWFTNANHHRFDGIQRDDLIFDVT